MVSVSNTYPHALIALRREFGGTIHKKPVAPLSEFNIRVRSAWEWRVMSDAAVACAGRVLPFLYEKKRQAELMIECRDWPARSSKRASIVSELKALKRIDYGK